VDVSLRLAVELPPVPASGPASLDTWWETALGSVRAGAQVVWFAGAPDGGGFPDDGGLPDGGGVPDGASTADGESETARWCDSCTIAAAAISQFDDVFLGVLSSLPHGRHPAILAREVTTLDVLSGGRAALLLQWTGMGGVGVGSGFGVASGFGVGFGSLDAQQVDHPDPGGEACEYLSEAMAVSRAVFQDDDPIFEGRYLHVSGAVNRPAPARPGGPPLLVLVPPGASELVARDPDASSFLRQAVLAAAAIVCPDDPVEVATWRTLLDDAARVLWTTAAPTHAPKVVVRTTVPRAATDDVVSEPPASRVARLAASRGAGADGIIVRLPSARVPDELGDCFEPWRR
jgi:alkanesulfonate monooxygenase SsuD/methylene tetrahydromethanopterin reductase-like flavin-dependent oxidoreductase (luciferase family)